MNSQTFTKTKIPRSGKDYLFVSMNLLMEILYGKSGLQTIYEKRREDHPGWPTYKSLIKYSSGKESNLPSRPSSQLKLDSFTSYSSERVSFSTVQDDFHWDRYPEWFGMLQGFPFHSEMVRNYWLDILAEGRILAFSMWEKRKNIVGSIELYNDSDLANKIGQPASRKTLKDILALQVVHKDTGADNLEKAMTADKFTVVVRVMAWIVADTLWGLDRTQKAEEMGSGAFLDFLLPRLDATWSNPVKIFFEKIAEISGWKKDMSFVSYLAERWDFSERDLTDKTDLEDKKRLIRMWKDDRNIVDPLPVNIESCMRSLSFDGGIYSDIDIVDMFYLAISMRKIWHYLKYQEMLPDELLEDVFSVYSQEFHHANCVLSAE
jgi:hypothetical protein